MLHLISTHNIKRKEKEFFNLTYSILISPIQAITTPATTATVTAATSLDTQASGVPTMSETEEAIQHANDNEGEYNYE